MGEHGEEQLRIGRGRLTYLTAPIASLTRGSVTTMNDTIRKNILILDPERDISELFARALERRRDCKCYLACRGQEAIDLLGDITFDLLLIDIGTVMEGDFSLLKKIRRLFPGITIIIDAYLHQKELITRALSLGASGYFIKPIQIDSFRKKMDEFYAMSPT